MLILVRHGECLTQTEDKMTGQSDSPLTPLGVEQALAAGDTLAGYRMDVVFASTLVRAEKTARLILSRNPSYQANPCEFVISPGLIERSGGELEGMTYPQIRSILAPRKYKLWQRDYFEAPSGGESMLDVSDRVVKFFKESVQSYMNDDKMILLVSHAVVMRVLIGWLKQMNEMEIPSQTIDNATPYFFNGKIV